MNKYGTDKPDIIFYLFLTEVTELAIKSDFSVFKSVIESKFTIDLSTENLHDLVKLAENQSGKKLTLSNKIMAAETEALFSFAF